MGARYKVQGARFLNYYLYPAPCTLNSVPKNKKMKKKITVIGVIIVVVVVILVWGINYLKGKDVFVKANRYFVVYEKIDGLSKSTSVVINGYKVGIVDDIYFAKDQSGRLVVELLIHPKYRIPKNSVAEIFSLDIMGTKGVKIVLNKEKKEFHKTRDTLRADIEGDLKDQVNIQILPLKKKAEDLIASFDSVLTTIRVIFNENTRQNLSKSFESIKATIVNLQSTTFTLDTIMKTEKSKLAIIFSNVQSITTNFKNNNDLFTNMIKNFSKISDSLAKADVVKTFNKANSTLAHVDKIMAKISSGEGSIGMLLNNDTLYKNLQNSTYNLNRLLRDVRENPKRYLHFSALDMGKTVYILEPEEAKELKKKKKEEKK